MESITDGEKNEGGEGGGISSIETTFDFFPFFVMEFYTSFRKNAILPSILCIALIFVFKTCIAGLTEFKLQR